MADERLLGVDEFLLSLIVTVLYESPAMTAAEIAKAATIKRGRRVERRSVEAILRPLAGGFVAVAGVPRCRVIRQRRGLLQRAVRWRLVAAEAPASPPDASGAPVPARPYPPHLSGAAAANLTFRDDEPPTNAIGKPA
jgi:hypothetical protein